MKDAVQKGLIWIIWILLVGAALLGIYEGNWSTVFVALATFGLTFLPLLVQAFYHIKLPTGFVVAIVAFLYGTLFLGEVGNFYERYWWWDIALHSGSAVGFGLFGFILMFIMFRGDKVAASPVVISMFAFCFAVAIGAIWEIFEYSMDTIFGLNMQKSGLDDTMLDLIVDCFGAFLGATAGFLYLKGLQFGGMGGMIDEFVRLNKRLFNNK